LHADLAADVPQAESAWHPVEIFKKFKAIDEARRHIEANANPRLVCEALLVQFTAATPAVSAGAK
jgi:hypothetical protein